MKKLNAFAIGFSLVSVMNVISWGIEKPFHNWLIRSAKVEYVNIEELDSSREKILFIHLRGYEKLVIGFLCVDEMSVVVDDRLKDGEMRLDMRLIFSDPKIIAVSRSIILRIPRDAVHLELKKQIDNSQRDFCGQV